MSKILDHLDITEFKRRKREKNIVNDPMMFQANSRKGKWSPGHWVAVLGAVLFLSGIVFGVIAQIHQNDGYISVMDNTEPSAEAPETSMAGTEPFLVMPYQERLLQPIAPPLKSQETVPALPVPAESTEPMASVLEESPDHTAEKAQPKKAASQGIQIEKGPYYTIQLVTYKSDERAKKEVQKLSDLGYEAFVVAGNKMRSVCVDKFADKASAGGRLSEVKGELKVYKDAYIRLVKS